jgi:hypothetical protein
MRRMPQPGSTPCCYGHAGLCLTRAPHAAPVWVDGGRLIMPEGENEQEHRWQGEDGKSFRMMWQLFRPGYGNTVELTTGGRSCG